MKNQLISLYRRLYRTSHLVPQLDKQTRFIQEIRQSYKCFLTNNKPEERSEAEYNEFYNQMQSKLNFIQMISPKMSNHAAIKFLHEKNKSQFDWSQNGTRSLFVHKDGELIDVNSQQVQLQKDKAAHSNWGMGNVDPDQLARHEALMRRYRFQDGPLKDYPKNVYGK